METENIKEPRRQFVPKCIFVQHAEFQHQRDWGATWCDYPEDPELY